MIRQAIFGFLHSPRCGDTLDLIHVWEHDSGQALAYSGIMIRIKPSVKDLGQDFGKVFTVLSGTSNLWSIGQYGWITDAILSVVVTIKIGNYPN